MKLTLAVLLIFTLIVSSVAIVQIVEITKADSKTITVPNDYPTIQQAINNALAGDTVYVKSGMYNESLTITKSLSLVGENKDSTLVVGSGNTACLIQHDNVTVSGFTFRRPSTMRWHYDIHLLNVKYCNVFENNLESSFYGIWLVDASFNNVFNNTVAGNWHGIRLTSSDHNNISNNTVTNSHDWGISTEGSNYNLMLGNYIASNGGAGVVLDSGMPNTNNLIAQNTITNNTNNGIEITSIDSSNNKIIGNTITANGETFGAAILLAWHSNLVMNNFIVGNQVGIRFDASQNNTIYQNLIENNPQGAILIHSPPYRFAFQNIIYKNNILGTVNLTGNVQSQSWDNSTIGNFWGNYTGTDADSNGIGDNSYIIDNLNIDHYPLISKVSISAEIPSVFLSDLDTPTSPTTPILTPTSSIITANPIPTQLPTSILTATPTVTPAPIESPTITPTATIPEFPTWISPLIIVITLMAAIIVRRRQYKQSS